jgi:hypothetical protein
VFGILIGGMTVLGCTSSAAGPASSASASVKPATTPSTPLAWVEAEARPANKSLNQDQAAVINASRSGAESDPSTFFTHLASACTTMLADAHRAEHLPKAPSAALASAWQAMAAATATYASNCLALTRTRTDAAYTTFNSSISPMDAANAALNSEVSAIRGPEPG